MTNKFKLTYASGLTEEVYTDAVDSADQLNRTFGMTEDEAKEFGVSAELLLEGEGNQPPANDSLFQDPEQPPADDSLFQDPEQPPATPNAKSESVDAVSATVQVPPGVLIRYAEEPPVIVPLEPQPALVPTVPPVEIMIPVNTPEQIVPDTPIP